MSKETKVLSLTELANIIAEKHGLTKKASHELVSDVLDVIKDKVSSGDQIRLFGFGSFSLVNKPARKGRNPKTGEEISIEAKDVVRFKPYFK